MQFSPAPESWQGIGRGTFIGGPSHLGSDGHWLASFHRVKVSQDPEGIRELLEVLLQTLIKVPTIQPLILILFPCSSQSLYWVCGLLMWPYPSRAGEANKIQGVVQGWRVTANSEGGTYVDSWSPELEVALTFIIYGCIRFCLEDL